MVASIFDKELTVSISGALIYSVPLFLAVPAVSVGANKRLSPKSVMTIRNEDKVERSGGFQNSLTEQPCAGSSKKLSALIS